MKKILLATLIFLLLGLYIKAQFIVGLKTGINFSNIYSDSIKTKSIKGVDIGFVFKNNVFNEKFELAHEFTLTVKGAQHDEFDLKMLCLNWNILINYFLKDPWISIQGGPIIGINTNSSALSDVSAFDASLMGGVSVGSRSVKCNFRYNYGLKNYAKNNDFKAKCNYFQISLSFYFVKGYYKSKYT